jgi:hypothetical protein
LQTDADLSSFIVGEENAGLFKSFLYPEGGGEFPFTTPSFCSLSGAKDGNIYLRSLRAFALWRKPAPPSLGWQCA